MLLLDTFELAVGLEDWLREQFVPGLPACALVVVAGRDRPDEAWRNDPMSADVEKQVLERYSEFLSRVDHKARMEKRLFALDNETAMRAARP